MDIMDSEIFLFDRVWFPKVFRIARESGLDWLRMCAAAEVLSGGDPRTRNIDWEYIEHTLGTDNPVYLPFYYADGNPSAEIIDRGTRWGLFQIHGERALKFGHVGRLVNLIDIERNIKVACRLMVQQIQEFERTGKESELPRGAEEALGWPSTEIDAKVRELKEQMNSLLTFGD